MPVLCTFACMCVERDFKSLSTTLFNCLLYCYNKFLPTKYLKNLICFILPLSDFCDHQHGSSLKRALEVKNEASDHVLSL